MSTRIVHFSDVHVGAKMDSFRGLFDKRLLGYFNYQIRRRRGQRWDWVAKAIDRIPELKPDLVVCTGDITSLGSPREFDYAYELLEPLVKNDAFDFMYVPGNHDTYVRSTQRLRHLEDTFFKLNRERWELASLPVLHKHDDLRLLLLNQTLPTPLFACHGMLDDQTVKWLDGNLEAISTSTDPLVLISHYPLFDRTGVPLSYRRACRNNKVLCDAFEAGNIDLALCGHIHHPFIRDLEGQGMECCAGSLPETGELNIIDWDNEKGSFFQHWESVR